MKDINRGGIPWGYLEALLKEKEGWNDLAYTLNRAQGIAARNASAIEQSAERILMTNATVSVQGKGPGRRVHLDIDQRDTSTSDGVTVGTVVSATNVVYGDGKPRPTEHILFSITVVDPMPRNETDIAEERSTVQVVFDRTGKIESAMEIDLNAESEEEEDDIDGIFDDADTLVLDEPSSAFTQIIENTESVQRVLRRMRITDPTTQMINPEATLEAMLDGVDSKLSDTPDNELRDILGFVELADPFEILLWESMPKSSEFKAENN